MFSCPYVIAYFPICIPLLSSPTSLSCHVIIHPSIYPYIHPPSLPHSIPPTHPCGHKCVASIAQTMVGRSPPCKAMVQSSWHSHFREECLIQTECQIDCHYRFRCEVFTLTNMAIRGESCRRGSPRSPSPSAAGCSLIQGGNRPPPQSAPPSSSTWVPDC